jgi:superfamily I DNA/RNA helicase
MTPSPSPPQREAIEAPLGPVLVLAGPGAGKTFCLIHRIRYLVQELGVPARSVCAFTFTNRAAEEITARLEHELHGAADHVTRGTVHAFCSTLLREWGYNVGLERGFGIADDAYQRAVLARLRVPNKWHTNLLNRFGLHRFAGVELHARDQLIFERYTKFLGQRNLVDFDTLVLKTAELLDQFPATRAEIAGRWSYVLVDEFQDMDPVQYRIVRHLATEHQNLFVVGDDEQSIYSWRGADPELFRQLVNDFSLRKRIVLDENRRCPRQVFALARKLVTINVPLFADKASIRAERESPYPVQAIAFPTESDEAAWLVEDLLRDQAAESLRWGEFAVLYRRHGIGDTLEAALLKAGIPCRLAQGRALTDDPVVAYVVAALKVIAHPKDAIHAEALVKTVLPRPLFDALRTEGAQRGLGLLKWARQYARGLPAAHDDGRKIRRALYAWQNLPALGTRHPNLISLIEELLSQRVGEYRSVLEERQDEITDPIHHPAVVALAERLAHAKDEGRPVRITRMGGMEIGLKGMLKAAGFSDVECALHGPPRPDGAEQIEPGIAPELGLGLGLFKAIQLVAAAAFRDAFGDFVAVDLETTDKAIDTAEIVEIAAVRVRNGEIVGEFHSLVQPRVPIAPKAFATHGISAAEVAGAPYFEEVWPHFRAFCGPDVLVAHNGYQFDFPILRRMSKSLPGGTDFHTYDSLPLARDLHPGSRRLVDLAHAFGIDAGTSHRALDDTRTLAKVFRRLQEAKLARARKTSLAYLLDHLGVALALADPETLGREAKAFREWTQVYALGRYSECLEFYRQEQAGAPSGAAVSLDELIERLGGTALMLKLRAERGADQRYPLAMARLRRLVGQGTSGTIEEQIGRFLELVALSRSEGIDPDQSRVNLLTLHSTKGLEFSRVYIVGVEDAQLPGTPPGKESDPRELEEARRLLYVGMTRVKDRLVLTRALEREERPTGGTRFLDEMELTAEAYDEAVR